MRAAEAAAKEAAKSAPIKKRMSKKQAAQAAAGAAKAKAAADPSGSSERPRSVGRCHRWVGGGAARSTSGAGGASDDGQPPTLAVGAIGFDRVGKRSVLRAIKEAAAAGEVEGEGGFADGVQLLTLPALLSPNLNTNGVGLNDILLRARRAEHVLQPEACVDTWLQRCTRRSVLRHFGMADFGEPHEFLANFAERETCRRLGRSPAHRASSTRVLLPSASSAL